MRLLKVLNVDYDDRGGSIVCSAKNALNKTGIKQRFKLQVIKGKAVFHITKSDMHGHIELSPD